ncbi:AzlD domain-containing protein [Nocardia sp. alder85J]|uniref:AzlD domain-containing protein n=1 Tax=Nocardia sp. alder85J TaxID=2862949 RepID=UPI001CD3A76D|nr:AzlD domain-containing protein [Nocardia sp. alder85J]MCX4099314.1 AzlD domain-containing protein [Nocardia sp. alder85J]
MNGPVIAGVAALSAGTYAIRFAGPMLRRRIDFPARVTRLLEIGSVVLLTALAATLIVPAAGHRAGFPLPTGVLVAGVLAWCRVPLIIVVIAAAATTAVLRVCGVP